MKLTDEREKLERLLDQTADHISDDVPVPGVIPEELQAEPTMGVDFAKLKKTCDKEAKTLLNNSIGFILSDEVIKDNAYLKSKLDVDVMSLSGMLYQLRVNESMQKALMNEVDRGMIHPRMFEVFSGLSKTIADINKQLIGTVEAIKSTYKEVKMDFNEKKHEALGAGNETSGMLSAGEPGTVVTMGTKELIQQIKKEKSDLAKTQRSENASDADIIDVSTT